MQPPLVPKHGSGRGGKWNANPLVYLAGLAAITAVAVPVWHAITGGKFSLDSYPTKDERSAYSVNMEKPPPSVEAYESQVVEIPTLQPTSASGDGGKPPEDKFRPVIDGKYDPEEWKGAASIDIQGGKLLYKNDMKNLYILLDVVQDTGDDPPAEGRFPAADGFGIAFDMDNNGRGTPMKDVKYSLFRGDAYNLSKQVLLSSGPPLVWSGVGPTSGELGVGFESHRFWEIKVPVEELGINPQAGSSYEMGVMPPFLWSKTPQFYIVPPQESFEGLPKIRLIF